MLQRVFEIAKTMVTVAVSTAVAWLAFAGNPSLIER
jgi:hypothetical protein